MQGLETRNCNFRDVEKLRTMLKRTWHLTYDDILGPRKAQQVGQNVYTRFALYTYIFGAWVEPNGIASLVAHRDGEVAGFLLAGNKHEDRFASDDVKIWALYVAPEAQGFGVGSSMIDRVLERFPQARRVCLDVLQKNAKAIDWYARRGFSIEKVRLVFGSPCYSMERHLSTSPWDQVAQVRRDRTAA